LRSEAVGKERQPFGGGLAGIAASGETVPSSTTGLDAAAVESSALVTNEYSLAAEFRNFAPADTKKKTAVEQVLHESAGTLALAPPLTSAPEPAAANAPGQDKGLFDGNAASRMKVAYTLAPASQRFVQVESAPGWQTDAKSELRGDRPVGVLNAFKLEQTGNAIRVEDSDGSVYSGSLQLPVGAGPPPTEEAPMKSVARNAPGSPGDQERERNYSFQVTGVNRSLKQNIVFNGNFLALTQATPTSNVANALTFNADQARAASNLLQLPLANSRISGTAVIDNRKEIQINAVPAKP
jgi:hypothetical protein